MLNENFDFQNQPGLYRSTRKIIYTGKPLISIITPYYNAKKYIKQTAFSILNQTFPYWEWIIVNDGSTDKDTEKVLNEIASLDSRIKIFNKENGGTESINGLRDGFLRPELYINFPSKGIYWNDRT